MITRMLQEQDRDACRLLWQERFDDSQSFIDWFFRNRFSPTHSVGTFDEDNLVSMSLGYPMSLTSPAGDVPAWMLSGISTLPRYERQGLMHSTVRFQMQEAYKQNVPIVFNHPVRLHQYDSLGFRPITDTLYYEGTTGPCVDVPIQPCLPEIQDMLALYDRLCDACFGCVRRSQDQFVLKMQDYHSDHAKILGLADGGRLLGYAVAFFSDDLVYAEEAVAEDDAYPQLLALLHGLAGERRLTAKLPPFLDIAGTRRPQNVAAFTDTCRDGDIQTFFGYPSNQRNCYGIDEY